jgi:DnaJ-like protein
MPTLIFGVLVLVLLLWALNAYSKADPKVLAKVLRPAGGVVALAVAAFLLMRGHLEAAIPLGLAGLGLLGWGPFASSSLFQRMQKTPGQVSRVRAAFVEMELDHDTGAMRGTILAGRHAGAALDTLDLTTLLELLIEVDGDSRALLEAYLDRREPSWRERAQGRAGDGAAPERRGKMTEEEAYQILGVPRGASADEIGKAHRSLMKKLHPDQGGSNYLAAQLNEAKELLLRRQR